MSCTDSKGNVTEPKIISIDTPEKSIGKPCIDFQPDDRWQIKEDVPNKTLTNSKANDVKNSTNGRRSLRLRSAKSNDSVAEINGQAVGSSSEDESKSANDTKEHSVDNGESKALENRHSRPRRKTTIKPESEVDSEVVPAKIIKVDNSSEIMPAKKIIVDIDNGSEIMPAKKNKIDNDSQIMPAKKIKVDIDYGSEIGNNCHSESEKDDQKENDDSNDKIAMPNLSPAATEFTLSENLKETSNISEEVKKTRESENEAKEPKDAIKSEENECEVLPKLDEFKKCDDVSIISPSSEVKHRKIKANPDIEVINLDDEVKKNQSDEESDSEVQIVNAEGTKKKPVLEFSTTEASNGDLSLSAGYPYYNSLKEKIDNFKAGDYKPVKFPHTGTLLLAENEVIIESPSLLVPLLIKENDVFPKPDGEEKKVNGDEPALVKTNMISKKNFFQSSVGQFLINLGMSRVQEWYHRDMKHVKLKQLKQCVEKDEALEKIVESHEKRHLELKEINAVFTFRMKRCKFCNFKTESLAVMEDHYLTPHLTPRREYRCNFCSFLTRDLEGIAFHFEALHGKKPCIINNIQFHECTFCSFQHHLKTKVNVHMNRCRKHFIPSQNLAPPFDFEFPGVTTKPVTINDVIGHRRLLLSSAKNQRMPLPEDNNPNSAYARKKLASVLSKITGQNAYPDLKNPNLMKQLMGPQSQMPTLSGPSIQLPPGIVITRPRMSSMPQMRPAGGRYPQPRVMTSIRPTAPQRRNLPVYSTASQLGSSGISITPVTRTGSSVPRPNTLSGTKNVTLTPISTASNRTVSQKPGPPQPVALFTNMAGSSGMMGQPQARLPVTVNVRPLRPAAPYQRLNTPPSQVVKGTSGNTFVMCEICDSYIKDLEELRTHMNWVHKVKIHPKMLVSRPPLNCQKCQWRFFTDQGLERHLLGAHGLVTTNMQEMANKNQDGGRCIICGAVFTYKLVSHMTQVHKVTLKPAHLSYKCTVCTATFTLYRLFESHVYNVHSGSAKRSAEEAPSSEPPTKKPTRSDAGPRKCKVCGLVTENIQDHLIKMHMRKCSVKLCRIEKCEKCLYSSDEMLVIRMSDFGIEDDLDESSGSSEEASESEGEEDKKEPADDDIKVKSKDTSDSESTSKTVEQNAKLNSEADCNKAKS